jgi:PAS domain-containing protein
MTKASLPQKILLIENDPAAASKIYAALAEKGSSPFELEWVRELSAGLERLREKGERGIDAVLLELSLPDSQGMEKFDKLFTAAPYLPILILGGNGNEALAKQAVGRGAQDYLLPGHLDCYSLSRALRNAIERKAVEDALYAERERAVVTLNSIGAAVLGTDISGKITYLNLVAETMTGWRREEAIGKSFAEVFRIVDGATPRASKRENRGPTCKPSTAPKDRGSSSAGPWPPHNLLICYRWACQRLSSTERPNLFTPLTI